VATIVQSQFLIRPASEKQLRMQKMIKRWLREFEKTLEIAEKIKKTMSEFCQDSISGFRFRLNHVTLA
jgi:hypothetical protein